MHNYSSTHRRALTVLASLLIFAPVVSVAGPQYVDGTGYAASGYDVAAYRSLGQQPVGESQPKAIPGQAAITAEWNGATWAFSTRENRDRFLSEPDYYAPAYDGHCAYGASLNGQGARQSESLARRRRAALPQHDRNRSWTLGGGYRWTHPQGRYALAGACEKAGYASQSAGAGYVESAKHLRRSDENPFRSIT